MRSAVSDMLRYRSCFRSLNLNVLAGRQHVNLDRLREIVHLAGETMATRDLERDQSDLPRLGGFRQRLLDTSDLEHEDRGRPQRNRSIHGDAVDESAIEEVLTVQLDGRQQPGHGRRGQNRVDDRPFGEPVLGGAFDAGGDALEGHRQFLDEPDGQRALEQRREGVRWDAREYASEQAC